MAYATNLDVIPPIPKGEGFVVINKKRTTISSKAKYAIVFLLAVIITLCVTFSVLLIAGKISPKKRSTSENRAYWLSLVAFSAFGALIYGKHVAHVRKSKSIKRLVFCSDNILFEEYENSDQKSLALTSVDKIRIEKYTWQGRGQGQLLIEQRDGVKLLIDKWEDLSTVDRLREMLLSKQIDVVYHQYWIDPSFVFGMYCCNIATMSSFIAHILVSM